MPARRPDVPAADDEGLTPAAGRPLRFLVTCEHGGNTVPAPLRPLFAGHEALLHSHRGHDPGALEVGRELAAALDAPLIASTVTRLVVDLNRSPGRPAVFSEIMRAASPAQREEALAQHYRPYRDRVESFVATAIAEGQRVVHLSSHSFVPVLGGQVRNADIGLLYDPARAFERTLAARWIEALHALMPRLRLRRNYPYTGVSDGLCAWLRRQHDGERYAGIELEINQRHPLHGGKTWHAVRENLIAALRQALSQE